MRAVPGMPIDPVNGAAGIVTDLLGGASGAVASTILDALSSWVAHGAASLVQAMAEALDRVTRPDLGAAWFQGQYLAMGRVAALLAVPLLFAAAVSSIIRQDARPLVRAVVVYLPLAGIGTGVAVSLTGLALAATDELCAIVTSGTSNNAVALFTKMSANLDSGVPGAGGFGTVLVAIVVAAGAFMLTIELIIRSAAVYVAMLFLPLALSGLVWPATARWGKRLAETLSALILSKFVMVAIISMAVAALNAGGASQGLDAVLTGAALLILAAIAPFVLLRMAPIVEAGAIGHLEGAGRRVVETPKRVADSTSADWILNKVRSGPPGGADTSIGVTAARAAIGEDGTQMAMAGADGS